MHGGSGRPATLSVVVEGGWTISGHVDGEGECETREWKMKGRRNAQAVIKCSGVILQFLKVWGAERLFRFNI